ncbi:Nif3-like dinuclear metal center hexameric protein [Dyadobacter jiangsuensis]|uniref:Putative NIF3 family GTP cyclohydrolase 1 type 2 n=1 Tax=Dyadobacter jiangsuensis TaxID=1591085 RepID=A0A2P8G838_9BACT|nr:Nif3-like dinuclear metal center hexameric protein [Dyadobacter jiangsuensis]PSL30136.1 putative NIF3 family GTP cyclohydrolase 1 type 2 [Dyadobacter jiangsuensis]
MTTPDTNRRRFLSQAALSAGAFAFLTPEMLFGAAPKAYTVQQIIDLILKEGNLKPIPDTVDTIKSGSTDQAVTGIVTTMFATATVIEQAAKLKANFIIAHEPTFFNHRDDPEWVKGNEVVRKKQALLEKHKIAVWRFHDYCHSLKPDAIRYGVVKKAGWTQYYTNESPALTIPATTLGDLVKHLKSKLGIQKLRVIGDLGKSCSKLAIMPGAAGGQRQVAVAVAENPDVLIVGETPEWEGVEYARDGRLLGSKMALIVLGHAVSEEPGMEYFVEWLQPKISGIKVTHVASGDPFQWI